MRGGENILPVHQLTGLHGGLDESARVRQLRLHEAHGGRPAAAAG